MTKLCMYMRPYLAIENDMVVKEGEVGEEMYMIVRGNIRLQSRTFRLYNDRSWQDGAFFGVLTVLGIGAGSEHNRHVYSATAAMNSECILITQDSMDTLQILHPTFKFKMREMAVKRAERFGYGERGAGQVELATPERQRGSSVHSELDRSLDKRRESGTLSRMSRREAFRDRLVSSFRDRVTSHKLPEYATDQVGAEVGADSETAEVPSGETGGLPLESLLQELITHNVQLAEQVDYLTGQVETLVRRSPAINAPP